MSPWLQAYQDSSLPEFGAGVGVQTATTPARWGHRCSRATAIITTMVTPTMAILTRIIAARFGCGRVPGAAGSRRLIGTMSDLV